MDRHLHGGNHGGRRLHAHVVPRRAELDLGARGAAGDGLGELHRGQTVWRIRILVRADQDRHDRADDHRRRADDRVRYRQRRGRDRHLEPLVARRLHAERHQRRDRRAPDRDVRVSRRRDARPHGRRGAQSGEVADEGREFGVLARADFLHRCAVRDHVALSVGPDRHAGQPVRDDVLAARHSGRRRHHQLRRADRGAVVVQQRPVQHRADALQPRAAGPGAGRARSREPQRRARVRRGRVGRVAADRRVAQLSRAAARVHVAHVGVDVRCDLDVVRDPDRADAVSRHAVGRQDRAPADSRAVLSARFVRRARLSRAGRRVDGVHARYARRARDRAGVDRAARHRVRAVLREPFDRVDADEVVNGGNGQGAARSLIAIMHARARRPMLNERIACPRFAWHHADPRDRGGCPAAARRCRAKLPSSFSDDAHARRSSPCSLPNPFRRSRGSRWPSTRRPNR
ncbi:Amino acid permease-associated region [Burkholderia cenocepacia PC184]|nr:Amino acid permease-associated region [Burkholderia cenocepacia PC184]